jgi:hypothetical protein
LVAHRRCLDFADRRRAGIEGATAANERLVKSG